MKYGLLYITSLLMVLFSCSSDPEFIKTKTIQPPPKIEQKDFYKFKHLLPESNYAYNIEITDIDFKTHKDAFSIVKEKYDSPVKVDGLTLKLKYSMTNAYAKAMQVPFPHYFYVTAKEFEGLANNHFIYSKSCHCYINNSTEVTNSKGKEIYEFTVRNPDATSAYQQVINFDPNEKKEFVITFTEPFPNNIKTISFVGFNATSGQEHALVIDLYTKKIIDRKEMKR